MQARKCPSPGARSGESWEASGPVRIAIEPQRRFERGKADFVDPQRALHGVATDPRQKLLAPDDETRLWAAEQLVGREGDEICAIGDSFGHRRFVREAEAREIDQRSRPFEKPKSGRIAVKVINHLGDEVMKVFAVESL